MRQLLVILSSALVTSLVFTSVGSASPNTTPPAQEIALAGLFDLTGGGAIWGKSEKNAFLLACRDFETQNPGYKVKPLLEDTMFSSRQTVTAFQKVTSVSKVRYVIGPTWETTVAIMPLCEAKKVICLSPSYHGKEYYNRPWRYNFTAWFDDRDYAHALATKIHEQGYKNTAIFAAITPYYDTLVETFTAESRSQIVGTHRVTLEERDFKSLIAKTPTNVDSIVMLLDNAGQIQAFLKQWSELRRDRPPILSDDLIVYLDPPDDVKRYGFRISYSAPLFDEQRLHEFTTHYTETYKARPEASSASITYDETMVLLLCIKRNPEVDSVRDCVANTRDYLGYSGTFSFAGGQTVRDRKIGMKEF